MEDLLNKEGENLPIRSLSKNSTLSFESEEHGATREAPRALIHSITRALFLEGPSSNARKKHLKSLMKIAR